MQKHDQKVVCVKLCFFGQTCRFSAATECRAGGDDHNLFERNPTLRGMDKFYGRPYVLGMGVEIAEHGQAMHYGDRVVIGFVGVQVKLVRNVSATRFLLCRQS